MKTKISALVSVIALTISGIAPANASQWETMFTAMNDCGKYTNDWILNPMYYGRTRIGSDIWICVETDPYGKVSLWNANPPYAMLVCGFLECKFIKWVY